MSLEDFSYFFSDKKILIADDEEQIRQVIRFQLEEYGAKVYEAEDGVVALNLLKEISCDLVITDVRMPGGNGVDLLDQMRKIENLKSVPKIVMSGFTDLTLEAAKDLGAITLISKPFSFSDIIVIIIDSMKLIKIFEVKTI